MGTTIEKMGFWRHYFRRKMNPLDPEYAMRMRNRFRALYFFGAWNLFTYTIYVYLKETKLTDLRDGETKAQYYARLLSKDDTTVYRYSGVELLEEVDIPRANKPRGLPWMKKPSEEQSTDENSELLIEETNSS